MEEVKFTPGPWRVEVVGREDITNRSICSVVSDHQVRGPVAAYLWPEDARLIAAAPEMLQMLRYCHQWLQGSEPHRARAVGEMIAKALGEQA